MSRRDRLGIVLSLLTLAVPLAVSADEAALIAYLNGLESFSADFTQQRFDEDGELLETSRGRCHIKRPGRFRWAYTEPYAQLIVSDGQTLWIYDEDLEQVTTNAVGEVGQGSPAALLGRETNVAAHYAVTVIEAVDQRDWFRLEPKDIVSDFTAVELAIGTGEVSAMRLTDNLGQVTLLEFAHIVRNGPIDDAEFAFTPPPGADVVQGSMP